MRRADYGDADPALFVNDGTVVQREILVPYCLACANVIDWLIT